MPNLGKGQREELEALFSVEKICKVVFVFDRNKSLGLDGFMMVFFQDGWIPLRRICGKSSVNSMRGVIDIGMSKTYTCLISKKDKVVDKVSKNCQPFY